MLTLPSLFSGLMTETVRNSSPNVILLIKSSVYLAGLSSYWFFTVITPSLFAVMT